MKVVHICIAAQTKVEIIVKLNINKVEFKRKSRLEWQVKNEVFHFCLNKWQKKVQCRNIIIPSPDKKVITESIFFKR